MKVTAGREDHGVAGPVARCLPAGGRVQPPADCGERDGVEEEPRGRSGPRLLLPQPARPVVITVELGRCSVPYAHAMRHVVDREHGCR